MATEPVTSNASGQNINSHPGRRERLRVFVMLFSAFLVIIAISVFALVHMTQRRWESVLQDEITRNLTQKAQMLANRVDADHVYGIDVIASQEGQAAGARATIVDSNGKVVADSEIAVASLADEGRRPEFVAALKGSTGVEMRSRNRVPVLYVAVPVSGGAVRLAYPMSDLETVSEQMDRRLMFGCAIAVLISLIVSAAIARVVVPRPTM
jgi:two-component system, OmpR family, phosphate regulon sensor histidine kinase PhoR